MKKHPFVLAVIPARGGSKSIPKKNLKRLENDRVYSFLGIEEKATRRQDLPSAYRINALIYVVRREALMEQNTIFGADTRAVIIGKEKLLDIDTELDFTIAQTLLKKHRKDF